MSDRETVSVCMATYNGAPFIREQLDSILAQLMGEDEIIIVDDASSDDTLAVIDSLANPRIKVHRNQNNLGYVRSFERALNLAQGDVLLLSDQDDVWIDGRVELLRTAGRSGSIAASNLVLLGSDLPLRSPVTGRSWLLRARDSDRRLLNQCKILLGDAPYFGCTMALRRDALNFVLPFPGYLTESHDLWIATAANATGELVHVEPPTVRRRVHQTNASASRPRGVMAAVRSRVLLLRLLLEAHRRRLRASRRVQPQGSTE